MHGGYMAKQHELIEQKTLFDFLSLIEPQEPMLQYMFHVPNGGHRHPAVAAQLKAAGVKRGVPDILFPISYGQYHGLAIELKAGINRTTKDQVVWLDVLEKEGWKTAVCYGWVNAAIETVLYIGKKPETFNLHLAKESYDRQIAQEKKMNRKTTAK
jgi:hypothetical protein